MSLTDKEIGKLIADGISSNKGCGLLWALIEEKAMTRISGPPEKMQQQSGVFNLWLEVHELIQESKL
jgi:hypothetical protein